MKNNLLLASLMMFAIYSISDSLHAEEARVRPESWAKQVIGTELENFYKIDENVYRSEQPDDDEFASLEAYGITSVLNLRNHHSDDDEAKYTEIKLHRVPMNAGSVTETEVLDALTIIKNSDGPIVFHCWHGSDRTGAVAAAYRVVIQGWSKEQAIDELIHGGYGYHQSFYPNIKELIKKMDVAAMREHLKL